MTEGSKEAVRADDKVVARIDVRGLQKRIHELERVLGQKTLENEILREALKGGAENRLHLRSLPEGDAPKAGCQDAGSLAIAAPRAPATQNPGLAGLPEER